jgi:hypothetical protein
MKKPTALHRSDYVWTTYGYKADASARLEDVVRPDFWDMVADQLKENDVLDVISDTKEFEVRLRVLSVRKNEKGASEVKLRVLDTWTDEAEQVSAPDGALEVEWAGPKHRWRVVDQATKAVMSYDHATKGEAQAAMAQLHLHRAA